MQYLRYAAASLEILAIAGEWDHECDRAHGRLGEVGMGRN
jgi:hypothetical protein